MNNGQTRASLFGLAAAYLLYLCSGLFRDRHDTATSMTPVMRWLFIGLFAAAGVCLLFYAWRLWKQSAAEASAGGDSEGPEAEEDDTGELEP